VLSRGGPHSRFEGGAQLVVANILCAFVVLVFVIFAIASAVN